MAAEDIGAEASAWALDAVAKGCFGEDFGVAVYLADTMVATPQGPATLPAWHLLLTARSPLLGQPPLFHRVPFAPVRPTEEQVREAVADGIRQLRDLSRKLIAGQNGKPAQVPG